MASASTQDICTQWTDLPDDSISVDDVERLLRPLADELWVSAACVDRILDDPTVQRAILDLGLERTAPASRRSQDALNDTLRSPSDESAEDVAADGDGGQPGTEERAPHASLVSHFSDEPADARLCRIRAVLLERLDRLNTFVELCRDAPGEPSEEEQADEEWEDDPWGDGAGEPAEERKSSGTPPVPLSILLSTPLLQTACLLASSENFTAVRILLRRHRPELWPCRFAILEAIPEFAQATDYRELLPVYDASVGAESLSEHSPWRTERDFTETAECVEALDSGGVPVLIPTPAFSAPPSHIHPKPLSSNALTTWYLDRVNRVISCTGVVDSALSLVQHAASQGVSGLDEVGEDLTLISRLVYDTPDAEDGAADDWTLDRWRGMAPLDVVRAYLARSNPETVAKDISRLAMPYLFVLESRAERAGAPDPSLATRLLYDFTLQAPLEVVASVFEASKPTLSAGQRLIKDDEDMARLALACLYGSESTNEWPTMSRIFECLPAWETPEETEDEADEADTTIASLGAFVAPSTTRPRCTPSDLLLFFKPLPMTSLSRALDVLDVHLESGEALARWGAPAPLRWLLQSNGNIMEQRAWANRMARRAGGSVERIETQDDWEWLLEDMLKLAGESGSRSAFCLLSSDDVVRIFFSGLLSTGNFLVAKNLLRKSTLRTSLDPAVIEEICVSSSQEFYDNASSGNYHFGDMKLAYDCLDVPESPSERIIQQKDFIEATSRLCSFNLMSRPGIPISPIEIRLTKDRLSLVSRVLSSNSDAYKHTQVILDLVHKLGFRDDIVAEVKTLAMLAETALQAEDFPRAYENSEKMVETILLLRSSSSLGAQDPQIHEASEVCWLTCFQLGRHPEVPDMEKKLTLLGRALELCPPERLPDILSVWRTVEDEDISARRERVAARKRGAQRIHATRQRNTGADAVSSIAARFQDLHLPTHLPTSPDTAALANMAFSRVAANFPFRGRSISSEDSDRTRSGSRSRSRMDGVEVSAQASRVLQKGIGWLLGADD